MHRLKYWKIDHFKIFKKTVLLLADMRTRHRKKLFSIFQYFSLIFSTNLIWSDWSDKNINRLFISWAFRKWAYFRQICEHGAGKNNFYNPHRKVRTLFPPKREKGATFIPYPHSSSQRHAHVPSAWTKTVRCAGNESEVRQQICSILSHFGGKRVRNLR